TVVSAGVEEGLTSRLTWANAISMSSREFRNVGPSTDLFPNGVGLKQSSNLRYRIVDQPEHDFWMDVTGGAQAGTLLSNTANRFVQLQSGMSLQWKTGGNHKPF